MASSASTPQPRDRRKTPMMRQYMDAKAECPGAILMFRMGDFYEMFFDDARIAARELELTLTAREKGDNPIPMAGVPHHAVSGYIARLVERGFTVAICDQIEDPKQAKGLVRRAVTRLVTPGTVSDLEALDPATAAYVACVGASESGEVVLALLDLLAGELLVTRTPPAALGDELSRMAVREVLAEPAVAALVQQQLGPNGPPLRAVDAADDITEAEADDDLARRFGSVEIAGLDVAGAGPERRVLERLVRFAESTQRRRLEHLMPPRAYRATDYLVLDEATRRNLELVTTQMQGERRGSLIWHLDRCRTALGSRRLAHWLLFPLRDPPAINARLDAVQSLVQERPWRQAVQDALAPVRDIERLVGRVAVGRATPRDVGALRASLEAVPALQALLAPSDGALGERWRRADCVDDLRALLTGALADDLPLTASGGRIFARGYRADLDELISLSTEGHAYLSELEDRERRRTGINNLKVRFNKVFGYYIEVTKANLEHVPDDFVRKQTLVGAERFITDELKQFESRVLTADERRKAREAELFDELLAEIGRQTARLRQLSRLTGEVDALASLAQVADECRYVRPELIEAPVMQLRGARHPVVERLMPGGERFVPNDIVLDADSRRLLIVTGPNMAGKSTVLRQTALITLLAQMGSFVPAAGARVGLADRIFTRVGAADNLGRGQSTFMVEMTETASILRHATAQSLVILDEIGRGTSTFDGVSLAWAVAEDLHDRVGCRTLFATHYHELTDLAVEKDGIGNVSVAVKEQDGRIVFLRKLVEGAANRSYGIQVAQLAGLPAPVLERARQILANLESGEYDGRGMPALAWSPHQQPEGSQLSLFASARAGPTPVEAALAELDPLNLTPIEALSALDRLKKMLG